MAGKPFTGRRIAGLAAAVAATAFVCAQFFQAASATVASTRENACRALGSEKLPPVIKDAAPPAFSLPGNDGKTLSLESFRGRPVLLNFWATWCPPCVEEMPSLETLARKLGDDAVVLAVSVDKGWDPIRKFFPRGTPIVVALDEPGEIPKTYGTEKYPETFLVDRDGRIRHYFINKKKWDAPEALDCVLGVR